MPKRRAVFLDRDGTVIRGIPRKELNPNFVACAPWFINEINFEPRLREAMMAFKEKGYLTIIATNQPDVAYGHLKEKRWRMIYDTILKEVQPDDHFHCPHRREDGCECKKPKPGMLLTAAKKHNIDLANSYMIGDTDNDTLAGKAAGCKTILIRRDYNDGVVADSIVPSLFAATELV